MASKSRFEITQAPNILQEAKFKELLAALRARNGMLGKQFWLAQFEVTQEAPDAIANINEGETNTFDGTAAAAVVDIVSSAAADKGKSGTLWGISSAGIASEDFTLDATDATTPVTSTTEWIRLIGMTLDAACAGNITVSETGGAVNQYMLLVAGDTYSISCTMWCPDGYSMAVVSLVPVFEIANGASPVFANGCNVGVNVNGTVSIRGITPENIGKEIDLPQPFMLPHSDDGYIAIQHETMDTDANITETITVTYLVWED